MKSGWSGGTWARNIFDTPVQLPGKAGAQDANSDPSAPSPSATAVGMTGVCRHAGLRQMRVALAGGNMIEDNPFVEQL